MIVSYTPAVRFIMIRYNCAVRANHPSSAITSKVTFFKVQDNNLFIKLIYNLEENVRACTINLF